MPLILDKLHLLSASTTMKMTFSKGGVSRGASWLSPSNVAFPGIKGLYGKKPVANTRIAIGIRRFVKASNGQEILADNMREKAGVSDASSNL